MTKDNENAIMIAANREMAVASDVNLAGGVGLREVADICCNNVESTL